MSTLRRALLVAAFAAAFAAPLAAASPAWAFGCCGFSITIDSSGVSASADTDALADTVGPVIDEAAGAISTGVAELGSAATTAIDSFVNGNKAAFEALKAKSNETYAALSKMGKGIVDAVREKVSVSFDDLAALGAKTWAALEPLGVVRDTLLSGIVAAIVPLLQPLADVAALPSPSWHRLALSRREPIPWCSYTFMGVDLQGLLGPLVKAGLAAVTVELAIKSISGAWKTMKAAGVEKYSFSATASTFKERVKKGASAAAAGISVIGAILFQLAIFPVNYVGAPLGCLGLLGGSKAAYATCYRREFAQLSKDWLWDGFAGTFLAPLDPALIIPLAVSIGTSVTAAITALTGGVAGLFAPTVGALVALATKVGIGFGLNLAAKKLFYSYYERTTWADACPFFDSLVTSNVLTTFGPKTDSTPAGTTAVVASPCGPKAGLIDWLR